VAIKSREFLAARGTWGAGRRSDCSDDLAPTLLGSGRGSGDERNVRVLGGALGSQNGRSSPEFPVDGEFGGRAEPRSRRSRVLVKEENSRARRRPSRPSAARATREYKLPTRGCCTHSYATPATFREMTGIEKARRFGAAPACLSVRPSVSSLVRLCSPPRLRPEYRGRAAAILGLLASLSAPRAFFLSSGSSFVPGFSSLLSFALSGFRMAE